MRLGIVVLVMGWLASVPAAAWGQFKGAQFLRIADSAVVQTIRLADGSTLVGRFIAVDGDPVRFETAGGVISVRRADLREIRESRRGGSGRPQVEDPDPTRLFFGPTARTLPKGEADFSDTYLFLLSGNYGVTANAQVGAGLSVFPAHDFSDNLFFVTGKVGVRAGPRAQFAVGGLFGWSGTLEDDVGGSTVGAVYGVGTFGSPNHALTVGLTTPVGEGVDHKAILLLGGETRIGRRVKLITENYFTGNDGKVDAIFGYGVRIFGDKIAVNLGFLNVTDDPLFPGLPYVDFVVRF